MKVAVRALVVATLVCAVGAIWAAAGRQDAGGVTTCSLLLVTPGVLVFVKPDRAAFLALWCVWGCFVGIAFLTSSGPMGSTCLRLAVEGEVSLAIVGSLTMAYAVRAHAQPPVVDITSRVRRVRSVAQLGVLIAVASIVVSWIVIGIHHWDGALVLTMTIVALVAPASLVYRAPTRVSAVLWTCWSLPLVAVYVLVWFATRDDLDLDQGPRLMLGCYGTLGALIAVVLPLVAFLSPGKSDIPEARVH